MTISLIIPVHNRSGLLAECLQSVTRQTRRPHEVIVVDDGSSEPIEPVVRAHYAEARLLRLGGEGPGAARDRGVRAATGEYLLFLDSDDLLMPWALEIIAEFLNSTRTPPAIACMSGRVYWEDGQPLPLPERGVVSTIVHADYLSLSENPFFLGASGYLVSRDAYLRCGGFSHLRINAEDSELLIKLGTEPGFTLIDSPASFAIRIHGGNISRSSLLNIRGGLHMIAVERRGSYPGGSERSEDRRRLICTHLRSMSIAALRAGHRRLAWIAYRRAFCWQMRLGRWRYLLAFPLLAAVHPRT